MASDAFDLTEQLQTPVFVMSDLDLGMNNWMSEPFEYPTTPINRGKVLSKEDLERLGSFARYKDVDGDGIGYRTLPGTEHPAAAWFARGSGHNEKAQYSERPDDYVNNLDRLARKFEHARTLVPRPEMFRNEGNEIGIIAYGTSHHALDRVARPVAERVRRQGRLPAAEGVSVHPRDARVHRRPQARLRRRPEPRRADDAAHQAGYRCAGNHRSCAACAITTGCRSTPAPSPTKSSPRRASKWRARRPHNRSPK